MNEEKIVFRYKIKNPHNYGLPCIWHDQWRRHITEPSNIHIVISRPSSLCCGGSQKHSGINLILPEQERIICQCDDWRYGEIELIDFQTPDMGKETYLSLKMAEGLCLGQK